MKNTRMVVGTYKSSNVDALANVIDEAIKNGINWIDTAQAYGNEEIVGKALQKVKAKREQYTLIAKIHPINYKYHTYDSLLGSAKRLNTNYFDVVLLHAMDKEELIIKAYKELLRAKEEGLAKVIGVSNFNVEQMEKIKEVTGEYPAFNQILHSVKSRTLAVEKYCKKNGIGLMAYSSVSPYYVKYGKYYKTAKTTLYDTSIFDLTDEDRNYIDLLSKKYNVSPAAVLLAHGKQNGYSTLIKVDDPLKIKENAAAIRLELSQEEMNKLNTMAAYGDKEAVLEYENKPKNFSFSEEQYKQGMGIVPVK